MLREPQPGNKRREAKMNSKIAVAIFIVALLLALIVKEGDCIQARTGKRSKVNIFTEVVN